MFVNLVSNNVYQHHNFYINNLLMFSLSENDVTEINSIDSPARVQLSVKNFHSCSDCRLIAFDFPRNFRPKDKYVMREKQRGMIYIHTILPKKWKEILIYYKVLNSRARAMNNYTPRARLFEHLLQL